jgi:hypothetical protein
MATMTYIPAATAPEAKAAAATAPKVGFFRRLVAAIQESRQRQAEIEIRRMRAITGDNKPGFRDALLPFQGE